MRPIRKFVLRLGDLAIPVGLVAAVSDRDEKLFRTLHGGDCKSPVSLRVYCPVDEQALDETETVKAWEVAPGSFIELDHAEVDALTPTDSSLVPLTGFVDAAELDPLLVRKRYHLAPAKIGVGKEAYAALAAAIHDEGVVAMTRFTAWNSEQIASIGSRDGVMLDLATLRPLDDIVQVDAIADELAGVTVGDTADELMHDVVRRYTRRLKVDDLASEHRPRVHALLAAKLAGQPIIEPEQSSPEPVAPVADLETALRSTLRGAPRTRRQSRTPVRST